jgi:hypothetical protein
MAAEKDGSVARCYVRRRGEAEMGGERERSCESSELNSLNFPKKQNPTLGIHYEPISGRGEGVIEKRRGGER